MKQEQAERVGGEPKRIRIQPSEIVIPKDDPFKNDCLGRQEPAEILTHLLGSLEGPCVLAIDAMWGNGKTTFLRMWAQHLRKEKFPVVEFNAWETDHAGDPFVALSSELTKGLRECEGTDKGLTEKITNAATGVLQSVNPGLVQSAIASIPLPMVAPALAALAEKSLSGYQAAQKSVKAFRGVLQNMAKTLSESHQGRPLVVMIDELDRCRPSYAVELLETAKHLFAVDHIVFVLAVNRSELAHAIKALYGSGFDAEGYLGRFFDVDFVLPAPERDAFIEDRLTAIQIDDCLGRVQDQNPQREAQIARNLLRGFFGTPALSLRQIAQAIYRLGLVLASLQSNQWAFATTAVVALILRTINADLYRRFVRDEISDLEVVDTVFSGPEAKDLRQKYGGQLFEAIIIIAAQEEAILSAWEFEKISSPLLKRYRQLEQDPPASIPAPGDPDQAYAKRVLALINSHRTEWSTTRRGIGFKESVRRLELLSADLKDEASQ